MKYVPAPAAVGTFLLLSAVSPVPAQRPAALPGTTDRPDAVRLEVGDLRRLASVMRSLGDDSSDTVSLLRDGYFAAASAGLRAYLERYDVTPEAMAAAIRGSPSRYTDLDGLADRIIAGRPEYTAAFERLREIYPAAVFPTVWFIAAHAGPGGLTRPEGAIVAAENYFGREDDLLPLVAHEVAHFQQAMAQGVEVYRRIYEPGQHRTLLALALREGTADLVAWLTTGRHINPQAERWALPQEAELWARFRADMHDADPGDWLFVRPRTPGQPPDVGYWIGYRIARAYYERAADKREAIHDMMNLTDFDGFLRASGYGGPPDVSGAIPAVQGRSDQPRQTMTDAARTPVVLVVDDDATTRLLVSRTLERFGFGPILQARDGRHAQEVLRERSDVSLVITDLIMPEVDGLELVRWGRSAHPGITWIILSGLETFDAAAEAVRLGAFDFLTKPPQVQQLRMVVRNALEQQALVAERTRLHRELEAANRELAQRLDELERKSALLQRDLERAEIIQRALLPKAPPALDHYCIHAVYRPGGYVGGDLYDVVPLGPRYMASYVADATGHGVTAAMLSVLFKQRLVLMDEATGRPLAPAEVLGAANRALSAAVDAPGLFLTAAYVLFDLQESTATIASAGHPPVLHATADGATALIRRTGPALALVPDAAYGEVCIRLAHGDRLLLFTDGLLLPGQLPDEPFLAEALRQHPQDPRAALRALLERGTASAADPDNDDVTLLLVHVHAGTSRFDNGAAAAHGTAARPHPARTAALLYGETEAASIIALRGRVVWTDADLLFGAGRAFQEEGRPLVLDLGECAYLDSTVLGTVHELIAGGGVELQRLTPALREAFEELSVDVAVAHVRQDPLPLPELYPLQQRTSAVAARQRMLEAHEALSALSERNRAAFGGVLDALRREPS